MLTINNYKEIERVNGDVYIVTIPFDKDCPLLKINFDTDSEEIEVNGVRYTVNDCLISDNGEWLNLMCDRIRFTRGGRRSGAGRPANDRSIALSVRITQEAMDILNERTTNKSEYIDNLIKGVSPT